MVTHARGNRATADEMKSYVDKYEEHEEEFEAERSAFMLKAKRIREAQKDLLVDAKEKGGWAKSVIKDTVAYRKNIRKNEQLLDEQEDDTKKDLVDLLKALGDFSDLPLGQAAVDAKPKGPDASALDAAIKADEANKVTDIAAKKKNKDKAPDHVDLAGSKPAGQA